MQQPDTNFDPDILQIDANVLYTLTGEDVLELLKDFGLLDVTYVGNQIIVQKHKGGINE
jgi:hypothetical protein